MDRSRDREMPNRPFPDRLPGRLREAVLTIHAYGNGILAFVLLGMAVMRDPDPGKDGRFWLAMLLIPLVWAAGLYPIARLGQSWPSTIRGVFLIGVLILCMAAEIALGRWVASISTHAAGS